MRAGGQQRKNCGFAIRGCCYHLHLFWPQWLIKKNWIGYQSSKYYLHYSLHIFTKHFKRQNGIPLHRISTINNNRTNNETSNQDPSLQSHSSSTKKGKIKGRDWGYIKTWRSFSKDEYRIDGVRKGGQKLNLEFGGGGWVVRLQRSLGSSCDPWAAIWSFAGITVFRANGLQFG